MVTRYEVLDLKIWEDIYGVCKVGKVEGSVDLFSHTAIDGHGKLLAITRNKGIVTIYEERKRTAKVKYLLSTTYITEHRTHHASGLKLSVLKTNVITSTGRNYTHHRIRKPRLGESTKHATREPGEYCDANNR